MLPHPAPTPLELAELDRTHHTLPNTSPALGSSAPRPSGLPPASPATPPALLMDPGPTSSQPFTLASMGSHPWAPFSSAFPGDRSEILHRFPLTEVDVLLHPGPPAAAPTVETPHTWKHRTRDCCGSHTSTQSTTAPMLWAFLSSCALETQSKSITPWLLIPRTHRNRIRPSCVSGNGTTNKQQHLCQRGGQAP